MFPLKPFDEQFARDSQYASGTSIQSFAHSILYCTMNKHFFWRTAGHNEPFCHHAIGPEGVTSLPILFFLLSAPTRADKQPHIFLITLRSVSYNHLWFQFLHLHLWAFLIVSSRNCDWFTQKKPIKKYRESWGISKKVTEEGITPANYITESPWWGHDYCLPGLSWPCSDAMAAVGKHGNQPCCICFLRSLTCCDGHCARELLYLLIWGTGKDASPLTGPSQ